MPNTRDLSLDEYGISKARYRELYYFCLQYREMLAEKEECYTLDGRIRPGYTLDGKAADIWSGAVKSAKKDALTHKVQKVIDLGEKIQLIEQTAIEAGGELYPWILEAVTTGRSWEAVMPPCYEKKFRKLRRKFYYLLSLKK